MPLHSLDEQSNDPASDVRSPSWIELRSASDAPPSAPLTTGDAALIAKVSQQTIIRAVTTGRLKGHKVPGSSHRRIDAEKFRAFLREQGNPGVIPPTEILVLGHMEALRGELEELLAEVDEAARVRVTEDAFTTGMLVAEAQPRLLVLDRSVDTQKIDALFAQFKTRDDVKLPARQSAKRGPHVLWTRPDRISTHIELADGNSDTLAAVQRFARRAFGEVAGARGE